MTESNHPTPDVAAELTLLAAWMDGLLAEETADRQSIAEQASARVKEIATAAADTQAQMRRVLDEAIDAAVAAAVAVYGERVRVEEPGPGAVDFIEPPETPLAVPLETRQQARELPAVGAIYDAMHAGQRGAARDLQVALLGDACRAAGVQTGAYDDRILSWLAEWEPETCAVIAGLIRQAAGL